MNKRGLSLIFMVFLIMVLLVLGASTAKIIYSNISQIFYKDHSLKAFYLTEAAIEQGKHKINKNPTWYTDLPHAKSDDLDWLINKALGLKLSLHGEVYKVVREKDKMVIYGIGYLKSARKVIKYDILTKVWEEL